MGIICSNLRRLDKKFVRLSCYGLNVYVWYDDLTDIL